MVRLDERAKPGKNGSPKGASSLEVASGRRSLLTHKEGRWLLGFGDAVALLVPMVLATLFRHTERPVAFTNQEIAALLMGVLIWIVLAISGNLYSLSRASSWSRTHRATVGAILAIGVARLMYQIPAPEGDLMMAYRYAGVAFVGFALWRVAFYVLAKFIPFTMRVLIVGAGVSGSILAEELHGKAVRGDQDYQLVGFIDDDSEKVGSIKGGYPVLSTSSDAMTVIESHQVDTLALAVNKVQIGADVFSLLINAKERGIRVCSMPALYESLTEKIVVEHVGDNWGIMFPMEQAPHPFVHDVLVRCVDIVVSVLGLILTLVAAPVISILNLATRNSGPLFTTQPRTGKGGTEFQMLRFRIEDLSEAEIASAWRDDAPTLSKVGKFLRNTGLENLPTSWNLLRGEMSLIGPQPERPEFTLLLSETIPFFRARHSVKPGVTGWAQVMYHYGVSEEDSLVKLQYDLYYIKHRSPAMDLRILAKATKLFFSRRSR